MWEIVDFNENHYSARQKIGEPGSKSIRNIFPVHSVTSKRPESPHGAKDFFLAETPVFQFFGLLDPYWFFSFSAYWIPIGPLLSLETLVVIPLNLSNPPYVPRGLVALYEAS
jgi:hypothetical protein